MTKHHIIYIPGLGDRLNRRFGQSTALALWNLNSVRPHYFVVGWANLSESFDHKLQRLLGHIDKLTARGHIVSLVAASAGASLAVVALQQRPQAVRNIVTICGKLHNPQTIANAVYMANPAFRIALNRFAAIEPKLSPSDRLRILTVVASNDNLVPAGDSIIDGSKIEQLPTSGHLLTIFAALTWHRQKLISFIKA